MTSYSELRVEDIDRMCMLMERGHAAILEAQRTFKDIPDDQRTIEGTMAIVRAMEGAAIAASAIRIEAEHRARELGWRPAPTRRRASKARR